MENRPLVRFPQAPRPLRVGATRTQAKRSGPNLTTYEYDGFDRLSKTRFPVATKGANASSTTDYEQLLSYDANSNPGSRRLRDGTSIAFTWDNLNRVTLKNLPGTEPDVTYAYDNLDRPTSATQTGNNLSFTWDALSRNLTQVGPQGTASYQYDAADRRTRLTYPGTGLYVDYDYLVTGEVTKIRENGATSGVGVLATYAYDNLGNRTSLTFGNGAVQAYTYDPVSRLASLSNDLSGTANDLSATFAYNPASQITSTTRTGDTYAWTGHGTGSTGYVSNGLNQQTSIGGAAASWDSKGNLTSEPQSGKTYGYSSENLLTSASGGVTLGYDPLLRLYQVAGGTTTRFAYDGFEAIAEYNSSNALQRRFVFGPGVDQPIVQYEGTGTTDRRFMGSDERGSVISLTDGTGALLTINRYDEYGKPQATNSGRFQYTGQKWIGEAGLYDYKFRDYLPHLGIFAQTDPLGPVDSPNLYAYVLNDPVNLVDPLGLYLECRLVSVTVGEGVPPNWSLKCYDNGKDLSGQYGDLLEFWQRNITREGNEIPFDVDPNTGEVEEVQPNKVCTVNTPEGVVDVGIVSFSGIPGHLHNPTEWGQPRERTPGPRDQAAATALGQAFVGTSAAMWVINYIGGQYSIGLLATRGGSPSSVISTYRGTIEQRLRSWNQTQSPIGSKTPRSGTDPC